MKTLLIMAGGTGGHVMPALAVAKNLHDRGVNIIWMGTREGIEFEMVPKAGFDLRLVNVKGLRGSGLSRKLAAPFVLLLAAIKAIKIIASSKANVILGMGGFVSGPGGVVGRLLGKPLVLHEQNAIAGTTNKLLAPLARRVLTGFADVTSFRKSEHIGNPVKADISAIASPAERLAGRSTEFNVLVIGGSQGAQIFNQELPTLLHKLQSALTDAIKLSVRHQCGRNNKHDLDKLYSDTLPATEVVEFIDDMAAAYQWSDVVICRAGAMTVAEIASAGAVALFIPYPYAIDDHQYYNAKAMVDDGAALSMRQDEFVQGHWLTELAKLAKNRARLLEMAEKARRFSRPDATQRVADICMEVMNA